ncbi:MAG TPA: tetratricopeptide repeat protein [Candidatus Baltobacteraceae bacterium]|jgi:tetratricopeptide (TPR) repeat protein|nr:tetratricopeptide repeat protein [Candidatus Baltobacteraceae bacterium]
MRAPLLPVIAAAGALLLSGCAGSVEHWIVDTRVHQGDVAMERGSLHEAQTAFRLALRVNPRDMRARQGFSSVSADIAEADYRKGDFDDAIATLDEAQKYDAQSVRLQALRSQIDNARLQREIIISNYPSYEGAGVQIQESYAALNEQTKSILKDLKRFGYTYDTLALTKAIQSSYELQIEVAKNTNRLIAYRQLVESGVPAAEQTETSAPSGSLLPLP